jgi:DNA-binding transcriptional ArsR family regulator
MNLKSKLTAKESISNLPPKVLEGVFAGVAEYFNVLSEPLRLRIIYAICSGEKSVSEVVQLCGSSQANVSRHLTVLNKAGILLRRKEGTTVFYSIADNATVDMCHTVCTKVAESLH